MNSLPLWIGLRYTGSKRRDQMVSFISLVSIIGLVMGVSLLIVVMSVMNGFDRELRERILGVMPQAMVMHRQGVENWQEKAQEFARHPLVLGAAPYVQVQGMISHADQVAPVSVYGVDASQEPQVSRLPEFIEHSALDALPSDGVLLGAGVAKKLGVAVGEAITLIIPDSDSATRLPHLATFSVAGIVNTGTEVDNGLAVTRLETAAALAGLGDRVTGIRLRLADLFAARAVLREILDAQPYGFYGIDWTRTHGNLFQAVQMSRQLVALLLFLIIAIAAFNVVSTLVMVVVDKQSQIAILRSLGASRWHIMGIFMVQGALIGAVGTSMGLLLGALGAFYVTDWVSALESLLGIQFLASDVYPISYLPSDFRLSDSLTVGAIALVMSWLATLYPAWRASRVAPAEALQLDH
ncbi:lipoprotein-releasing ABC transporter permease subunit [Simiduia sp. 21SJ11W-1]|uniref:lipoprotein-releasing ABC transporter permease subunit n=1 Tax=Simiduia sp. 21SJ11W-1 TaxID=2909669 RepID=UPI0020A009C5|nr:lipoprotein-releasing ABC transporter permease subunit [Simiduia sp. 21SJ11W-1]UTA49410.1 lipoprotein-releasing ABC transporter permease subunit [Simiduia sp. 21SJ11W-1]